MWDWVLSTAEEPTTQTKERLRESSATRMDGNSPIRIQVETRSGSSLVAKILIAFKETPCCICWDVRRPTSAVSQSQFSKTFYPEPAQKYPKCSPSENSPLLPYSADGADVTMDDSKV